MRHNQLCSGFTIVTSWGAPNVCVARQVLRTDQLYYCTCQCNNKAPGYPGGGWHSHPMGGGFDMQGLIGVEEYFLGNLCSLTLACASSEIQASFLGNYTRCA